MAIEMSGQAAEAAQPTVDAKVLIDQLQHLLANPGEVKDETQRQQIKRLARQAAGALEQPFETVQRLVYSPLPLVTSRVAQQHQIFSTLTKNGEAVSLAALTQATGLEPRILESILDYLGTQDMVRESAPGEFSATQLTHLLTVPLFQDAVTHFHDNCLPAFNAMNTVLGDKEANLLAFKVGQHSEEDFYTWMETHPVQQGAFHRFMEAQFASLPTWLDAVDLEKESVINVSDDTQAAFVDVGGGNGQQCQSLRQKFPETKGRVVLQDRPEVLEKALVVDGMEKMAYDFLKEQPIKNARVYYFRQIMHNYDDETCVKILQSHLPALGPDSVIIIDDKVLPDAKPPPGTQGVEYTAALSLAMKVMFNALERREAHWRQLLDSAGLEIKDVRKFTNFDDSVIIAVKKQ